MPWLLNIAYGGLLLLAAPVLLYRMIAHGKYRNGWREKFFGWLQTPPLTQRPRIWFHAVSVGEVLQLRSIVDELLRRNPAFEIVVTTTTVTGLAVAREKFPEHHVCYFPLDFTWSVRNAVARMRPDAVVLVELELWPNFIREVHRRGIPLLLINGRISEKSFRGYRRLRFLMRTVLRRFTRLAAQNETYAQRLRELGAPADCVIVTGSIKFDAVETDRDNPKTTELRRTLGIGDDETVFIAGSTHPSEERIALNVWQQLREDFPSLRLILVPRHRERFEDVARLVVAEQGTLLRRSEVGDQKSEVGSQGSEYRARRVGASLHGPVILLDTLGELTACWGLADVAFVGGSLTSRGGQNMIEPAGYGAAVLFGPNTRNFRDVVEMLSDGDAARVVHSESELAAELRRLLSDEAARLAMGQRARRLVMSQRGAAGRTVDEIQQVVVAVSGNAERKSAA